VAALSAALPVADRPRLDSTGSAPRRRPGPAGQGPDQFLLGVAAVLRHHQLYGRPGLVEHALHAWARRNPRPAYVRTSTETRGVSPGGNAGGRAATNAPPRDKLVIQPPKGWLARAGPLGRRRPGRPGQAPRAAAEACASRRKGLTDGPGRPRTASGRPGCPGVSVAQAHEQLPKAPRRTGPAWPRPGLVGVVRDRGRGHVLEDVAVERSR
jgi:hypothetical protein